MNAALEVSSSSSFHMRVMNHFVNQRKLLFWKSMFLSENDVLASLSRLTSCRFLATGRLTLHRVSCPHLKSNILFGTCLQTLLSCDGRFIHMC